jgi:hypothetical protein
MRQLTNNLLAKTRQESSDDPDKGDSRSRSPLQRGIQNSSMAFNQHSTQYGVTNQPVPYFAPQFQYQHPFGQTLPMEQQILPKQHFLPQQQLIQPRQWNQS